MRNRLNSFSGVAAGTATLALLFPLALTPGCAENKPADRADAEKKFLAPTDVNKLTPAAREALSRMPGGDKAPPVNGAAPAPK